jgi:DNA-binding transcriptional ArsR family regulator
VPDVQEEIYSTMFSSLKHPARRKILRVLSEKPLTFSEMLDLLGVSSSNLTYHLESLGELVTQENGIYKLSTFGSAAVSTMRVVEEAPEVQPKKRASMFKLKTALAVSLIALIVVASVVTWEFNALNQASIKQNDLQSKYNQLQSWTASTSTAINFLQQIPQIDTSHYQATLVSDTVDQPSNLGGILEQTMMYSLTSSDSKMEFSSASEAASFHGTKLLCLKVHQSIQRLNPTAP